MTHTNPCSPLLAPTSPPRRGRPAEACSPLAPLPTGASTLTSPTTTTTQPRPRPTTRGEHNTPRSTTMCVPSVSQRGPRGTSERVCPPSPLPTGGTHSASPSRVRPGHGPHAGTHTPSRAVLR